MDLDDQAVRARGGRGEGHRRDEIGAAGGMARVDDHGKVRQLLQNRHGAYVKDVSGVRLEPADAALAEDDLLVAARHDVFGAHQKLLERAHQSALQ